ncbi:MAG: cysteine desulfurase family protein [Planctomycetota bacterium]|nr:cysteine desulfurase family protein [Planctomycetota bacterium]
MAIHLDHNATTPLRPEVRELMLELLDQGLGNASSVHAAGRRSRAVIDDARERVAGALQVHEDEVVFTSGGTESNNLALFGAHAALSAAAGAPARVVSSRIEHAAVLEPVRRLEDGGAPTVLLANDSQGCIDPEDVAAAAGHEGPVIVSLMAANNEVGSVVDLQAVRGALGRRAGLVLHTDAVQLLGKRPSAGLLSCVDLASFSAHKAGGPVGVGLLLRKEGTRLVPRAFGGSQETELRPGTENPAAIGAAALAIELAVRETEAFAARSRALLEGFWTELRAALPDVHLNGPPLTSGDRLPNTINVSFPFAGDARMLVARLDLAGLELSAGSACASGSLEPSHVLEALGHVGARAVSALRISTGRSTDARELSTAVDILRITLGEAS